MLGDLASSVTGSLVVIPPPCTPSTEAASKCSTDGEQLVMRFMPAIRKLTDGLNQIMECPRATFCITLLYDCHRGLTSISGQRARQTKSNPLFPHRTCEHPAQVGTLGHTPYENGRSDKNRFKQQIRQGKSGITAHHSQHLGSLCRWFLEESGHCRVSSTFFLNFLVQLSRASFLNRAAFLARTNLESLVGNLGT